jgi:hypothetical protein
MAELEAALAVRERRMIYELGGPRADASPFEACKAMAGGCRRKGRSVFLRSMPPAEILTVPNVHLQKWARTLVGYSGGKVVMRGAADGLASAGTKGSCTKAAWVHSCSRHHGFGPGDEGR